MKKLITSALPYVNNVPHLGNIIGCVLSADAYARYCRLRGYETLYVCGTDEYGTATETKAREEGLTPREICDKYHAIHKEIYANFNISFDIFGRTSTDKQTEIAQGIFKDLEAAGLILEETTSRVFCEKDNIFLADRYVEGICPSCGEDGARGDQCDSCGKLLEPENLKNPRCKICGSTPVLKETSHLYLRLDALQDKLKSWSVEASKKGNWTNNAIQNTLSWFEKGLQPRPITRDLKWGIPVPRPGYENKVFYVWFDAPIGYISITAKARDDWKEWWQNPQDVTLYQFMAKDNIPFHTVIFPASLIGTGKNWTLLHHINAIEYLNYENTKFSKSRNIGVFGNDVKETGIHIDLWRFYLLANRPERNDSQFTWDDFIEKVNSEFTDNIGNMVNRTLVYLKKNFEGVIKDVDLPESHRSFIEECKKEFEQVTEAYEAVRLRDAVRTILAIGNRGNKFFQDMQPWEQIKTEPEKAHATVSVLTYLVKSVAIALCPIMPETANGILEIINIKEYSWNDIGQFSGMDGHTVNQPSIVHKKLDPKLAEKFRKQFSGKQSDFGRVHLRIGKIEEVKKHPNADQLYWLSVDLGEETPRSIVAGLVKSYAPEEILGRKVIVLSNLKPTKIRDIKSEGMILVCKHRNKMELLDGTPFEPGDTISAEGEKVDHSEISIEEFNEIDILVKEGLLMSGEQKCHVGGVPVVTHELKTGKVC
ncbi:MAG: methionine--tRNA ligase [Deltaproteobacteria bacterium]|nr:methionine--tRNA ligase [Deltaproteobacteria bacterium]